MSLHIMQIITHLLNVYKDLDKTLNCVIWPSISLKIYYELLQINVVLKDFWTESIDITFIH
jgi:hypothetical protein